ncbi:MAG: ribosomal protein S18-alanine N-acetyltransferase [Anaerolineales bacterium]
MSSPAVDRTIRPMLVDDLPAVLRIDRLSFATPWSERTYRYELFENPTSSLLVAEELGPPADRVVGYIGYWLIVDEMHISTLAVDPANRRKGLGGRLLRTAMEEAAEAGAEVATLEVRESNVDAIQLYRSHTYEIVGRRPRYYRDNGEDALLMTRRGLRQEIHE